MTNHTDTLLPIVLCIIVSALMTLSYYLGKISERKDWNKLIDEGKIQKPKDK